MDIFNKCCENNAYLNQLKPHVDVKKLYTPLTGPISSHMNYDGKIVTTWCFNDYLGLSDHPENREVEIKTITAKPVNYPMGSRLLSGNSEIYKQLEKQFSMHVQKQDCMIFATCYLAAIGIIPALARSDDCIVIDAEAHACLYDSAKIAVANGAKLRIFKHNDMESLQQQLELARRNKDCGILIICDGVYSMSGELANLPKIIELKKIYQARLLLDDAHGGGTVGKEGRGTANHYNTWKDVDLILNSFSKAFGSSGGCVSGAPEIIEYLRFSARTNIFSHNLQTIFIMKVLNSLKIIYENPDIINNLNANMAALQNGMRKLGLEIGNTQSPIIPLIFKVTDPIKQIKNLVNIVFLLRDEFNIYVSPVTYPAVPSDRFLIRFTATARHTSEDVESTLAALRSLQERGLLNI